MDLRLPFPITRLSSLMPAGPSEKKRNKVRRDAHTTIARHLRGLGIPAEHAADRDGWHYLALGSTQGRVGVVEIDDELFLHAEGVLMRHLPSDKDLIVPLMRELLERNVVLPESAKFGIVGGMVMVVITRPLADLSSAQIGRSIVAVMAVADSLDDTFLAKYGGTTKKRRR